MLSAGTWNTYDNATKMLCDDRGNSLERETHIDMSLVIPLAPIKHDTLKRCRFKPPSLQRLLLDGVRLTKREGMDPAWCVLVVNMADHTHDEATEDHS